MQREPRALRHAFPRPFSRTGTTATKTPSARHAQPKRWFSVASPVAPLVRMSRGSRTANQATVIMASFLWHATERADPLQRRMSAVKPADANPFAYEDDDD